MFEMFFNIAENGVDTIVNNIPVLGTAMQLAAAVFMFRFVKIAGDAMVDGFKNTWSDYKVTYLSEEDEAE